MTIKLQHLLIIGACGCLFLTACVSNDLTRKPANASYKNQQSQQKINLLLQEGKKTQGLNLHKKAVELFTQAININHKAPSLHEFRALSYVQLNKIPQAFSDFTEEVNVSPKGSTIYLNRANLYLQQKQYKEAIDDYKKHLSLLNHKKDWYVYHAVGVAFAKLKRHQDAVINYTQSINLYKDYPNAYYNRAVSLMRMGDNKDALLDLQTYIEKTPHKESKKVMQAQVIAFKLGAL